MGLCFSGKPSGTHQLWVRNPLYSFWGKKKLLLPMDKWRKYLLGHFPSIDTFYCRFFPYGRGSYALAWNHYNCKTTLHCIQMVEKNRFENCTEENGGSSSRGLILWAWGAVCWLAALSASVLWLGCWRLTDPSDRSSAPPGLIPPFTRGQKKTTQKRHGGSL